MTPPWLSTIPLVRVASHSFEWDSAQCGPRSIQPRCPNPGWGEPRRKAPPYSHRYTKGAALCLKALAYASRRAVKDAVDVWRLLAVCHAAGVGPDDWGNGSGIRGDAVTVLRRDFGGLTSPGLRAPSADRRTHTRVRTLVQAVLGPG